MFKHSTEHASISQYEVQYSSEDKEKDPGVAVAGLEVINETDKKIRLRITHEDNTYTSHIPAKKTRRLGFPFEITDNNITCEIEEVV